MGAVARNVVLGTFCHENTCPASEFSRHPAKIKSHEILLVRY
jgi:hypothetical protein